MLINDDASLNVLKREEERESTFVTPNVKFRTSGETSDISSNSARLGFFPRCNFVNATGNASRPTTLHFRWSGMNGHARVDS